MNTEYRQEDSKAGAIIFVTVATIGLIFTILYALDAGPFKKKASNYVPAYNIALNANRAEMKVGQTVDLIATVSPSNTDDKVKWSSSNPNVAIVDASGVVTAQGAGSAVISAKANDAVVAKCIVNVSEQTIVADNSDDYNNEAPPEEVTTVAVNAITLSERDHHMNVGDSFTLTITIEPPEASESVVYWFSSNQNIATVSNGIVTALAEGETTISAVAENGIMSTCYVTVGNPSKPSGGSGGSSHSGGSGGSSTIQVSKVSIKDGDSVTLTKGQARTLSVSVSPSNASNQKITWKSNNESVVSVSKGGTITAKSVGSATITATSNNGKKDTIKVIVNNGGSSGGGSSVGTVQYVFLSTNYASVTVNGKTSLSYDILPLTARVKSVKWSSDDTSIATVDSNGVVTGKGVGTTYIRVDVDGKKDSCRLTVQSNEIAVSSISLNKTSATIGKNATLSLKATFNPSNATNTLVTWSSSNTAIATVNSSGVVTGKAVGTARITAMTANGKAAYCSITVAEIPPTGIKLNKTSASITVGSKTTITATISPSNTTNTSVTWSTSDSKVATVSKGVVTGVKAGTATITAKTSNGKTATCKVTVTPIRVTGVTLNRTSLTLFPKGKGTLTATVAPSNAANKAVTWSSSNKKVATVNSSGVVTAVGIGSANITVKTSDGGKTATCKVTVKKHSILILGNSKTYRTQDSLKKTRPSKQFVVLGNEGGYLTQANSTVKAVSAPSNSYIGKNTEVTIVTKNGSSLLYKAQNSPYKPYINAKVYDIVILQENLEYGLNDYNNYYKGVEAIVKLLKNFTGTIYIRTSWPKDNSSFSSNVTKMVNNANKVKTNIKNKYNVKVEVINEAAAFKAAKAKGIKVHRTSSGDDNHQSENGAYLSALCMYRKVFNADATKVTNNLYTSSASTAKTLKSIANTYCK